MAGWTRKAFRETVRVIVMEEMAPLENRLQALEGRLHSLEKSIYRMAYILVESHNFQGRFVRWIMAREAEAGGDSSYELAELFIPEEIGIDDILVEGKK